MYPPRIPRICEQCGKQFETHACYMRKGPVRFCSRACYWASKPNTGEKNGHWKGGIRKVICAECGKNFERPLTWPKHYKKEFCNQDCRTVYQRTHPELTNTWKGGVAIQHYGIRKSWEYIEWRKAVFRKDNFTCQKCGQRGGRLTAHHLYRFSEFPHLRLVVNNGHTLCHPCHLSIKRREADYLISIGLSPTQPPLF